MKLKMLHSRVKCKEYMKQLRVLLYGFQTWRMTIRDAVKLDTFLHKHLQRVLRIYWPMRVTNEEVRRRARTCTISEQIWSQRKHWLGHVLYMDQTEPTSCPNLSTRR